MKIFFNIINKYDLIRLGQNNDGGYLAEKKSVLNSKFLVGMGLSDDWSFEETFVSLNPVEVHVYDHTVNKWFWVSYYKELFTAFFKNDWSVAKKSYRYLEYLSFFRNKTHFKECIGRDISIRDVFSRINSFPVFLKIDIEGSEYKILDELVAYSNNISGLIIEFHYINIYLDKICSFVRDFDLDLVHIHGNNYGGQSLSGYPLVLEFTFSKNPEPLSNEKSIFPHPLDMPNDKNSEELDINFVRIEDG